MPQFMRQTVAQIMMLSVCRPSKPIRSPIFVQFTKWHGGGIFIYIAVALLSVVVFPDKSRSLARTL